MKLAYNQASINLGNTKENPSVGCVITKNNHLISAGRTEFKGRPHAEHTAINFSKENLHKANLYVTIEPCSHTGKTPPCVNKIVKNKIKKVYFSVLDPDKRSFNKSSKILNSKGILVSKGIFSKHVNEFYKSYFNSKKNHLPFVTCKLAVSKDFFTINKKKKWITNSFSRSRVHLLRSTHDCILTSSETIIQDNPLLNCRVNGLESRNPAIVILDKNLRVSPKLKIFNRKIKRKIFLFYNKKNKKKIKIFNKINIKTIKISLDKKNNLNLKEALYKASALGNSRIFLESGLKLTTSFFKNNLINEFKMFISNKNINDNGSGSIKKIFNKYLKKKKRKIVKVNLFDNKLLTFKIK